MRPSDRLKPYERVLTVRVKAGEIPLYVFMESFLYIQTEEGDKIRFILNDDQVGCYEEMCKQRLKGQPVRLDILKARRIGFSTFIAGVIFCEVLTHKGRNAVIVADIAEHATNLYEKYQFFYDNLPEEIRTACPLKSKNAKALTIQYPDGMMSSVRIVVQGDNAGRSGTFQYLHMSECAFWSNLKKTLISLNQTVSSKNVDSMVFLETTANGYNEYKEKWDKDVIGKKTLYKACFYPWWSDRKCRKPTEEVTITYDDLLEFEKEIMREHNLTMEQMAWYDEKFYTDCDGDEDAMKQEYPSTPAEAFISTGNSVFDQQQVRLRKEELYGKEPLKIGNFSYVKRVSEDGNAITVTEMRWVESKRGNISIYEDVKEGHPYVCCMDPANGGEDSYVIQVLDNHTGCQVAVYSRNKCTYEHPTYQFYCLCKYYNNALATAETNTNTGALALMTLSKCGHRNIYQDNDFETLTTRFADRFGYKTKTTNRDAMIDLFAQMFSENPNMIRDYGTLCEMEAFQVVRHASGLEKREATGGAHDDRVMAMCGIMLCRTSQTTLVTKSAETRKAMPYDPLSTYERKRTEAYQIWD